MLTLVSPIRSFLKKGDLVLLLLCLVTSLFGVALIFSATRWNGNNREVIIQLAAIALGSLLYLLCTYVDFPLVTGKKWKIIFLLSVVAILLLLTPLGKNIGGNRNWLDIPGFPVNIQPNEVVKIPFILLLAHLIHSIKRQERDISALPSLLTIGGYAAFMLGLIAVVCGDMGMCVVYSVIFLVMAWSAGVKARWFVGGLGSVALAAWVLWTFVLPKTKLWDSLYLIKRFRVLFEHNYDPLGIGFQQNRSILAIGSGQITGKGFLQGTMTQSPYESTLPARDTDFIFAVCGEELGMLGCLALLTLLTAIILRCIWVAKKANSPFDAYVCMGMAGMLMVQIAANIGMCLFLFPVMGLTLPFVSYGGSSILTLYVAMGLVSSAKARALPSWLRNRE